MEITLQKENKDGSADYLVNISVEETEQLVRYAMIDLLKRLVEEGKKYDPTECDKGMGDSGCGEPDCSYGPCVKSGKSEQPCYCAEATQVPY